MSGFHGLLELQAARGGKEKRKVLEKYAGDASFRALLYYALNPLLHYNLSEKTIRSDDLDVGSPPPLFFKNLFECCEYLSRLRGIDNFTIRQVQMLVYRVAPKELRELYIGILSKTLRLGVTAKTVNAVIPNLIPEWEVQQAFPLDKYPIVDGTEFWLTQKLNGVRATWYNGELIARSGIPYRGLEHITSILSDLEDDAVLDGELTLADKTEDMSDNEAFRIATGIVNADEDTDKTRICFTVFDRIPRKDFENQNPKVLYSTRRMGLDELVLRLPETNAVRVLPVLYHGKDQSKIDELLEQMVREDKEGLMLNLDVPYLRTRHRGILKVKRFYTMDLQIIDCEEGSGRLEGTLGAFVLSYKGNEVRVGSGFTDEQRDTFWQNRGEIAGTYCEVKYKEISKDKSTGMESLQFPVFIQLRTDKTEESYG